MLVFVSYSHLDATWLRRFLAVAKPLRRYAGIDLWSDDQIESGDRWRDTINRAMDEAVAAVLLVSVNFLNSDFIADVELPYILMAARKRRLRILWVQLTPCHFELTPVRGIQAAAGVPEPLNAMTEYGWMTAYRKVCGEIDAIIRKNETPVINPALRGRAVKPVERKLQVLAKPAMRETEVLVYSNGNWYTQSRIAKGSMTTDCWFGDPRRSKLGAAFKIVALTRAAKSRLSPGSKHRNLPENRSKSQEITVKLL